MWGAVSKFKVSALGAPLLVGTVAALTLAKRPIPKELVRFRRGEQMARLKHRLFG